MENEFGVWVRVWVWVSMEGGMLVRVIYSLINFYHKQLFLNTLQHHDLQVVSVCDW